MKNFFLPFFGLLPFLLIGQFQVLTPNSSGFTGFGSSVDLNGCKLIVGAPNSNVCTGSAYVFEKQEDGEYIRTQILTPDECSFYGAEVLINDTYAIIAAHNDTPEHQSSGSVYIYEYDGESYQFLQKIVPDDAAAGDEFGWDMEWNETYLAVGTRGAAERGKIYIYTVVDGLWELHKELFPPEAANCQLFGSTVEISDDFLASGDIFGSGQYGNVVMFTIDDGEFNYHSLLNASDAGINDYFGYSIDIDGDQMIIGSLEDKDAAWECGSAYTYEFNGDKWIEKAKFVPENGAQKDRFAFEVGIQGDKVIISAIDHDFDGLEDSGAIYSYNKVSSTDWSLDAQFIAEEVQEGTHFGWSFDMEQDAIAYGSYNKVYVLPGADLCTTVSTNEIALNNVVSLSPNPASSILEVSSSQYLESIRVINITGQIMQTKIIDWSSTNCQIDISQLPSGKYYLQAVTKQGTLMNSFIKE